MRISIFDGQRRLAASAATDERLRPVMGDGQRILDIAEILLASDEVDVSPLKEIPNGRQAKGPARDGRDHYLFLPNRRADGNMVTPPTAICPSRGGLAMPAQARHRFTFLGLAVKYSCIPCQKKTCPLDHRCMTRLTPAMVYDAAIGLLPRLAAAEPGQTQSV